MLRIEALSSVGDYYVICTAHSEPQIRAIVEAVETALIKKGCRPLGTEGMNAACWVLMDCNDVLFHIFTPEMRAFYNLDRLWNDAPRTNFPVFPRAASLTQKRKI